MLKYRLQGTRNAIKMGMRIILRSEKVEIVSISDLYPEKGSNKYHRVYVEVIKIPKMNERIRHENSEMCKRFFESQTGQFKRKRTPGQNNGKQAEKPAAKGLVQLLKSIIKVRKHINSDLKIEGILPTMVDGRLNYSKDVIRMIEDSYGSRIHIYENYIPRTSKMAECAAVGESIFAYAPKTKAADAYMNLAKEVLANGTCTE